MSGLGGRLRRVERAMIPPPRPHVVFLPDALASMRGETFDRWKAAVSRDVPAGSKLMLVQFRVPGQPPNTDSVVPPEKLWPGVFDA